MPNSKVSIGAATRRTIELLTPLGPIVARPLFGTCGLYLEDRIFGLVHDDVTYFRTSDASVAKYEAEQSEPFIHRTEDGIEIPMSYHAVPTRVLADPDLACAWAYEAAATPD
jgi:DNA transformation protein